MIRDLGSGELDFLGEMLYTALDWRPDGELPPFEFVVAHPQVRIFHQDWGRPGDTALVAEEAGRLVGLMWYRLFTVAEHGEGFVDEQTPELAIAVVEEFRGGGLGAALMQAIHEQARRDRISRISLSVDRDNPPGRCTHGSATSTSSQTTIWDGWSSTSPTPSRSRWALSLLRGLLA